jgi:MFS family permease
MKTILRASIKYGLGNRPVRWVMFAAPFTGGVSIYAFYAMQPYLLQLYGETKAYGVAGLAAAIVAGAQIAGGLLVPYVVKVFDRRTSVLIVGDVISVLALALIGFVPNFWVAVILLVLWALMFSAVTPIRQGYINALIPSQQRATVLSFDSLFGSTGGVVIQPVLGKAADVWGYPASYKLCAVFRATRDAWRSRRRRTSF